MQTTAVSDYLTKIQERGQESHRFRENFGDIVPTDYNDLATRMAAIAHLIRKTSLRAFDDEDKDGSLHVQLEEFRQIFHRNLQPDEFADIYAQTITYGLFAARCNHRGSGPFVRERAASELPTADAFLTELFAHIASPFLNVRLASVVDHLAELLNRTDVALILEDFGRQPRREDPVAHFYETFLTAYDPALREARGVYYTPEPVVSYIVRSVDRILRQDFGLKDGLADSSTVPIHRTVRDTAGRLRRKRGGECHRVLILDPATGTGTFLHGVIDHIYEHLRQQGQAGAWSSYVSDHLLPRLFGFELLMAPYAVAHMKLGSQLAEMGYDFKSGERLRIYLTNTLEEAHELSDLDLFVSRFAEAANSAGKIKSESPVMVVLGNPPYSGHSENRGQWITHLMRGQDTLRGKPTANYFEVDGQPLGERNPKWLNDDYVKFIRFAQWRIEQTGYGILAFISNHGYLDNPTFRGMRHALLKTFDKIFILDLHGNTKKKETAPDGSKDENVFDIQQGVAIALFVKHPNGAKRTPVVKHAHLFGLREAWEESARGQPRLVGGKYRWLYDHDVKTTKWKTLKPRGRLYLLVPQDADLLSEYEQDWKITDAMPVHSLGIATARDGLTIHHTPDEVWKTVCDFSRLSVDEARKKYALRKDVRDWKVDWAQQDLRDSGPRRENIIPLLYRPFDTRFTYYTGQDCGFMCRPRAAVMQHMVGRENLALSTTRAIDIARGFEHVFCSSQAIQLHTVSIKEVNYLFPLYLYPGNDLSEPLFDCPRERRPNFSPEFTDAIARRLTLRFLRDGKGDLKESFGPEDVFHYIYAVLHSPGYRSRYAQFLKSDFPRIPLPSKSSLFRVLCSHGEELTELHSMRMEAPLITQCPASGRHRVESVRYTENGCEKQAGRVWINDGQYFEGVPREVWEFRIGGYRVCEKWLKDRKGRDLSYAEIEHYQHVVSALAATIRLMAKVDQAIVRHGGWPAAFHAISP